MAVFSFLEEYDLSDKTIVPFYTFGSNGSGQSFNNIESALSDAAILDGFRCRGGDTSGAKSHVDEWLDSLGVLE